MMRKQRMFSRFRALAVTMLILVGFGLAVLVPGALSAEESPQQVVTTYMDTLKANDFVGALRQVGVEIPPMLAIQVEIALTQQPYVQFGVKDYKIKEVRIDGGLALVTVDETRFFDLAAEWRAALAKGMGKAADELRWGDHHVTETFVLVRLDKKWKFDTGHSGVRVDQIPLAGLMEAGMQHRVADQAVLSKLVAFINNIGVGQAVVSMGSLGNVAPAFAAIAIPNFTRARGQGQLTACKSNLKNIGTALEMYSTDNEGRFPTALGALTPNYLKTIPTCPTVARDTYSQTFVSSKNPDAYTVMCTGENHSQVGMPPNYPQYNSWQGLTYP